MENKKLFRIQPADYVLAVLILAFFSAPLFSFFTAASGTRAVITKDNVKVAELSLSKDSMTKVGGMLIEVKGGRIRVASSDCPKHICSHAGWISKPGQSLVCLPNKVLIEIPSKHGSADYDTVSY